MRKIIDLLFFLAVIAMAIVTIKSCVDEDRKLCDDKGGYYFRGHCIKDGKIID